MPRALLVILGVALLLRVGVVAVTPDFVPLYDAADYNQLAREIADGHGYQGIAATAGPSPHVAVAPPGQPDAFHPPLYPFVLSGVYAIGGGWNAGRALGAVLGAAIVFLVFVIAQRLWGRRVALVAAAVAAVFPPLVFLNASLLSEPLFITLMLGSLLAVLRYRDERGLGWVALAGVLCGLATLTRNNGTLLVLALLLGVWTLRPRSWRRALVPSLVVVACALVTVSPWLVRNAVVFHRFVGLTTQSGVAFAGTYNADARRIGPHPGWGGWAPLMPSLRDVYSRHLDQAALDRRLTSRALSYIGDHPGYFVEASAWNALRVLDFVHDELVAPPGHRPPFKLNFYGPLCCARGIDRLGSPIVPVSVYLVLAVVLATLAGPFRRRVRAQVPAFVWAFPLATVLPAVFVFGLSRYRAPADPFLVMLGAAGVVAAIEHSGLISAWTAARRDDPKRIAAAS